MRYLDPRNDLVFRRIFGTHKSLCISLLNSLLPLPADGMIVDIEYCDPTMFPETMHEKNSVVDVSCRDGLGRQFLVEMQMFWYESFMPRTLLNGAKAYVRQSQKGKDFSALQPVYSLCILNDVFLKDAEYAETFRHVYTIQHNEFPELTIDGMTFVFVELPKFRSVNRAHNRMAELWLKFLNETGDKQEKEIDPELMADPLINEAIALVAESSYSSEEIAKYEAEWDKVSVRISTLKDAERRGEALGLQRGEAIGLEKGEAIGLEKGEAIGLEKGEAIGLEKGEAIGSAKAKREMARILKGSNTPIEVIAAASGLSIEEIAKL